MKIYKDKIVKIVLELSTEETNLLKSLCNRPIYFPEPEEIREMRTSLYKELKNQLEN